MNGLLAVAVGACLAGCGSTEVRTLGDSAVAQWESLTDDSSRAAIRSTLEHRDLLREDYRIGPEDVLAVSIFEWELREETRTLEARVAQSGVISLPVLGSIRAVGLTADQLKQSIEDLLRDREILKAPRVSVEVKVFQSRRVSIVGAVQDPGVYTLQKNVTTLLDALALAGGPNDRAGQVAYVVRASGEQHRLAGGPGLLSDRVEKMVLEANDRTRITVDLYELMELGNLDLNMVLQHSDVLYVPEAPRFFVFGYVREPGGFPLKRPTTVLDAVATAKGLELREASPAHCSLKRRTEKGEVVMQVNLVAITQGDKPNFFLKEGDVLEVSQTTSRGFLLGVWDTLKSIVGIGVQARS